MPTLKLTKRVVDDLVPPTEKPVVVYRDRDLRGFGLRVYKSGKKVFYIYYRTGGGGRGASETAMKLGPYGILTVDQARALARQMLARVIGGDDPNAERAERRVAITVAELFARYLREEIEPKKKPGTVDNYSRFVRNYVVPALGKRKAREVKRSDISRVHREVGMTKPPTANRLLTFISAGFSWGMRSGELPKGFENPAKGIGRFREKGRERFLTGAELARLGEVLREAETVGLPWTGDETKRTAKHMPKPENRREVISPFATAAIRLLLFTGCRLREILHLRWRDVDLERGMLFLPDTKTGRRSVLLNGPAMAVLDGLPRIGSVVVPGANPEKPRADLQRPWAAVIRRAGLDGLRIHDLRHTFASVGAMSGMGLPVVGKLLGHTQAATTAKYSHLADETARRASEEIGSGLAAAMGELIRPDATVIPYAGVSR